MLSKKDQCFKAKKTKPRRMSSSEKKAYINWLEDIGSCQICGSYDIDFPHHVERGSYKNDYMQLLLCVGCHKKVHNVLFKWHITPNQDQMEEIAKQNRSDYENSNSI